ncbi:TIGR04076 family protein [Chloroflexota bacterium]
MAKPYKIEVTVHSITNGECCDGHKVGESWLFESSKTPDGMCSSAYQSMYGAIQKIRYRGQDDEPPKYISCPLAPMTVYELKKVFDI